MTVAAKIGQERARVMLSISGRILEAGSYISKAVPVCVFENIDKRCVSDGTVADYQSCNYFVLTYSL